MEKQEKMKKQRQQSEKLSWRDIFLMSRGLVNILKQVTHSLKKE